MTYVLGGADRSVIFSSEEKKHRNLRLNAIAVKNHEEFSFALNRKLNETFVVTSMWYYIAWSYLLVFPIPATGIRRLVSDPSSNRLDSSRPFCLDWFSLLQFVLMLFSNMLRLSRSSPSGHLGINSILSSHLPPDCFDNLIQYALKWS